MDYSSKVFARRVLLGHLLLLAVVLLLVYFTAREIFNSARTQAIEQARTRQELLSAQTARGIESFYQGIISDLNLLRQADADDPAVPSPAPPAIPSSPQGPLQRSVVTAVRERAFVPILWNQLHGRVSTLVVYDKKSTDLEHAAQVLQPRDMTRGIVSPDLLASTRQIAAQMQDWLAGVTHPAISRLCRQSDGAGVNLVCVPFVEGGRRLLIAVVPAAQIAPRFMPQDAERITTSATLMDDDGAVMASSNPSLTGTNLKEFDDPYVRSLVVDYTANPRRHTQAFEQPLTIRGNVLSPRLVTVEPVDLDGNRWCLLIASPMSEVDHVVNNIFRKAVIWAIFVVVSVTAILVSTATQMIRSQLKLERVRHELLTRELSAARQIQLNWLPKHSAVMEKLDIAAANHPASHISGDFYNWFELPDNRQVVTIGDVTGHGMAAAFLMATTQLLVRNTMVQFNDPGKCLEEVNRQLCVQVFNGQFVTMLILVLDTRTGHIEVANAGHPAPLISTGNGFAPMSIKPELVLGVETDQTYPTEKFVLHPQSSILLFTDGVIEMLSPGGDRFTTRGLEQSLSGPFTSAQEIIDAAIEAVTAFRGPLELDDDLTMVAVKRR